MNENEQKRIDRLKKGLIIPDGRLAVSSFESDQFGKILEICPKCEFSNKKDIDKGYIQCERFDCPFYWIMIHFLQIQASATII